MRFSRCCLILKHYLGLVDLTGRIVRENKRGSIAKILAPILRRLHIEKEQWLESRAQLK
jgi:hypothetical protein